MNTTNERKQFISAIKYAFSLRLGAPYSEKDVPTIGIVFGNQQLATLCHEYINNAYENGELSIVIVLDKIIARVELREVKDGKIVFVTELNCDKGELMEFKAQTPSDGKPALIFGFKYSCRYYATSSSKDFSPIVLAGFQIIE
jgi:hypothetical protein